FISDPYFEEWGNGDWEKGEPNKYTKKKEGNRTYLYISGKGSVSQSVILPKKSSGESTVPPFYSLSFDYSVKNKASVSLILTYMSGEIKRDKKKSHCRIRKSGLSMSCYLMPPLMILISGLSFTPEN
ncbi:hypothetical protein Q4R43_14335, partial [Morganella morganii]